MRTLLINLVFLINVSSRPMHSSSGMPGEDHTEWQPVQQPPPMPEWRQAPAPRLPLPIAGNLFPLYPTFFHSDIDGATKFHHQNKQSQDLLPFSWLSAPLERDESSVNVAPPSRESRSRDPMVSHTITKEDFMKLNGDQRDRLVKFYKKFPAPPTTSELKLRRNYLRTHHKLTKLHGIPLPNPTAPLRIGELPLGAEMGAIRGQRYLPTSVLGEVDSQISNSAIIQGRGNSFIDHEQQKSSAGSNKNNNKASQRQSNYEQIGKWEPVGSVQKDKGKAPIQALQSSASSKKFKIPDHLRSCFGSDEEEEGNEEEEEGAYPLNKSANVDQSNNENIDPGSSSSSLLGEPEPMPTRDGLTKYDIRYACSLRINALYHRIGRSKRKSMLPSQNDVIERAMLQNLNRLEPVLPSDIDTVPADLQEWWNHIYDIAYEYKLNKFKKDQLIRPPRVNKSSWNLEEVPSDPRKFAAWRQHARRLGYSIYREDRRGKVHPSFARPRYEKVIVIDKNTRKAHLQ